jgi:predicted kinase
MAAMQPSAPAVHLLAGLNGAGKTTLARELQAELPAVRFSQDEWMLRLFRARYDEPGYASLTRTCRDLMWDTALQVLAVATDVVLDWNCWSRAQRAEWSGRAAAHGYRTILHYLPVPVETAVARAAARTAEGTQLAYDLDAPAIRHLASIFEEPELAEGIELHVVHVRGTQGTTGTVKTS